MEFDVEKESVPEIATSSSIADSFLEGIGFGGLSIDPINYEAPSPFSESSSAKFYVPKWASVPGPSQGVVLHEVRDGKTAFTHDLDLVGKKYYLFGRAPTVPCSEGVAICIQNKNVSRLHFAVVHSKYEAFYLIDLGSVHGTFVGKNRVQSYHPIQLSNGNVVSLGGCDAKFLVRVFPKKPGLFTPFSSFATTNFALAENNDEVDEETELHTHFNQVPDVPSPKGTHLVKPSSFYTFSEHKTIPEPLPKAPTKAKSNSRNKIMFKSPTKANEMEEEVEDVVLVEKLDLSKPFDIFPTTLKSKPSGILRKKKTLRGIEGLRKVSFSNLKSVRRLNLTETKSRLNVVQNVKKLSRIDDSSDEEDDAVEVVESVELFDPVRDLPTQESLDFSSFMNQGFKLDLDVINKAPTTKSPKSDILRTYSVQNVKRGNVKYSFSNLKADEEVVEELSVRRRGEGFENASPLSRQVKRAKSFHVGKS